MARARLHGAWCGVALVATLDVIEGDYRGAFLWLGLQIVIDATDGLLARALRVKERLPDFDGARLDDIIDYLTYVFIPVLLLIHAGVLPQARRRLGRFTGFAGERVRVQPDRGQRSRPRTISSRDSRPTGISSRSTCMCSTCHLRSTRPFWSASHCLVFVPLRYVYPSRTRTLSTLTNRLGAVWGVLLAWITWRLPATDGPWIALSLIFPIVLLHAVAVAGPSIAGLNGGS